MTTLSATFRRLSIFVTLIALISALGMGCKSAPKVDEGAVPGADENAMGDSDSGKAMGLQTINFPYDSFTLDGGAKGKLKGNADILKGSQNLKIQVEGHCDDRGGIQYNIALGEKRANAVKKYLTDMGVAGDRITTISFGKERLIAQGSSEDAHARNRRANFVITSR
jgi:peptidoglycan-associated lipoprotein